MKRFIVSALACAFVLALGAVLFGCSSGGSSSSASGASASTSSQEASDSASTASSSSAESAQSSAAAESESGENASSAGEKLANGEYTVSFDTDSNMFHVNEADEGKGVLTVADGEMTVHIRLVSKRIENLYPGTAEQAKADPDGVIQPTTDTVTYSDGMQKEVYGFDVPVPAIDQEFDVAILGSKGKWYSHKVTVSDPVAI